MQLYLTNTRRPRAAIVITNHLIGDTIGTSCDVVMNAITEKETRLKVWIYRTENRIFLTSSLYSLLYQVLKYRPVSASDFFFTITHTVINFASNNCAYKFTIYAYSRNVAVLRCCSSKKKQKPNHMEIVE